MNKYQKKINKNTKFRIEYALIFNNHNHSYRQLRISIRKGNKTRDIFDEKARAAGYKSTLDYISHIPEIKFLRLSRALNKKYIF